MGVECVQLGQVCVKTVALFRVWCWKSRVLNCFGKVRLYSLVEVKIVDEQKRYCDACGAEADASVVLSVQYIVNGRSVTKCSQFHLCTECRRRMGRWMATDGEQRARVARTVTDPTRQLRSDEVWAKRKALRRAEAGV